jgi:hypothetical protein
MEPRWGHAGGQAAEQRQRVHVDRDGSVGARLLQRDAHQAVGAELDALLSDRWTQHVTQERLAARLVERARARGRVQGEPMWPCRFRIEGALGAVGWWTSLWPPFWTSF